jgi:hypothetical protein
MKLFLGFIAGVAITYQVTHTLSAHAWESDMLRAYQDGLDQTASQYHEGYKVGRYSVLSELVECEYTTDHKIINEYLQMSMELSRDGLIDNSPYPCED